MAWRLRRPRPFDGFVDRDVGELFERFVGLYIGELLESRGWTRAGLTFAKLNSIGDAVFLNVQLSQSSHGSFIAFFVNENAAPRPWSEFRSALLNTPVNDWEGQSIVGLNMLLHKFRKIGCSRNFHTNIYKNADHTEYQLAII